MIKKARPGEFRQLISVIKLAILDKRRRVAFFSQKFNYTTLLASLQTAGFVENYEIRGGLLLINLKQTYWKAFSYPVQSFIGIEPLRVDRRLTSKNKNIAKFQKLQGQSVLTLFTTDKGIISGLEATAKKVGGLPLFKIY